jgi:ankyrin repeat protein
MTQHRNPDYLQMTPEEEQQIRRINVMREIARAANASQPQTSQTSRPAYMEGAVMMTELEVWSRCGRLATVKQALLNGADVNATDEVGMTALHYAVLGGEIRVVQLLLNAGANVQAKSPSGETPIDLAKSAKENALVRVLKNEVIICLKCDVAVIPATGISHQCTA